MTKELPKRCAYYECRKVLKPKPKEVQAKFERRKYCNLQCYGNSRATGGQGGKHGGEPITCKCPLCEKGHTKAINWIGRGTPWIYCHDCKQIVAKRDYEPLNTSPKMRFSEWR
jgi:hypothetical protein